MLSEQEIVRRESLQAIRDLGINPFPAEKFEVNFKSTDFTSADFKRNIISELEKIKNVGKVKAEQLADYLLKNKFRANVLMEDAETMTSLGLAETVEWDEGVDREPVALADYIGTLRSDFLGDFSPEKLTITIGGRFMGQRGSFANLQDAYGRIQLFMKKGTIGTNEEEIELTDKLMKYFILEISSG